MAVRESLPRSAGTRTSVSLVTASSNLDDFVLTLGVGLTHQALGELAHAGLGHLVDVGPALRQLPAGHAGGQVVAQVLGRDVGALADDDAGEGAFAPALVGDADHGRFQHVGVRHQGVLQLDRGDPLPAGLDHVLAAVADAQVSLGGDAADVAGAEPAVVELGRVVVLVVGPGDPRAADLDLADRLAVPGQHRAGVTGQPGFHRAEEPARAVPVGPGGVAGEPSGRGGRAAQ